MPTKITLNLSFVTLAFVFFLAVGGVAGYSLRSADLPRLEEITAAPEVKQGDGSVVVARSPPPKEDSVFPGVSPKIRKPPHKLPEGAVEERRVEVVIQPEREDCPPVQVDLSIVRHEGGRRVIASSPDGSVLRALDMPIEAALMPKRPTPWAAGVSFDPQNKRGGVWIERDISRLRLGADLQQAETGELRAMVRVGWRW